MVAVRLSLGASKCRANLDMNVFMFINKMFMTCDISDFVCFIYFYGE